mmetsp:Transcript_10743/g.32013  ORF Transcript_10743/g.32013 Transcript_10743/m.32013 type:complete len:208 (-) Transcript_10743:921-1544(-)
MGRRRRRCTRGVVARRSGACGLAHRRSAWAATRGSFSTCRSWSRLLLPRPTHRYPLLGRRRRPPPSRWLRLPTASGRAPSTTQSARLCCTTRAACSAACGRQRAGARWWPAPRPAPAPPAGCTRGTTRTGIGRRASSGRRRWRGGTAARTGTRGMAASSASAADLRPTPRPPRRSLARTATLAATAPTSCGSRGCPPPLTLATRATA